MRQGRLFDEPSDTAGARRDEALARVAENAGPWLPRALELMRQHRPGPMGDDFTGEDLRVWLTGLGCVPHHHNAWGALILAALREGIIRPNGRRRAMQTARSHARTTTVYEWV